MRGELDLEVPANENTATFWHLSVSEMLAQLHHIGKLSRMRMEAV